MDDTSMNRVQRWVAERSADRYRALPPALQSMAMARDAFIFSARGAGLWAGTLCGLAGTTYGIAAAPSRVAPWLAFVIAALLFAGIWKLGLSVWLRPERFTARRLWRGGVLMMFATYVGALASFSRDLGTLMAGGTPWYEAVVQVAWRATPLQLMLGVAGLLLLSGVSAARREYLQRALQQVQAERERDAAARQLAQARLTLLQAQIQPHFLFNTLAALQHWVDVGDARAAPLLRALTAFLRGSTELMLRPEVTLAQECEMVAHYLAIMQARLGDRLRFAIDIAPDCADQPLPPGLLITLVENAIEHGIEPQLRGGEVRVVARREGSIFELRVLDDGIGLATADVHEGVGLANSRERLRHQFGARAELTLTARDDGPGAQACLRLHPLQAN
jgi:hypothetical protein